MASAMSLMLKVSKNKFLDSIARVSNEISNLEAIKSEYNALLDQLDSDVIEKADDNFLRTEENVRKNIKAVEDSLKICYARRDELKAAAEKIEEASDEARNVAQSVAEKAENAFESAKANAAKNIFG